MPESAIVLLSPDAASAERIAAPLRDAGHGVAPVTDAAAAIAATHGAALILVAGLDDAAAAAACRRIRETPSLRGSGICVLTATDEVDVRVGLIEAGADEVLPDSVDPRELEARLAALRVRTGVATTAGGPAGISLRRQNRSFAVFSPTGGAGTTTIAVNLAIALNARQQGRVAIADLHLPFGQVASHLDLQPRRTIVDLMADELALFDPSLIASYAERHASGLTAYAAPATWEPSTSISAEAALTFVETATLAHDRVVIDLGSSLDERVVAVVGRVDVVVVPVRPEVPGLRAVHAFVDVLNERGERPDRILFVLNALNPGVTLKPRDIESALGARPAAELPYDPSVYVRAANQGIPVMLGAPASTAAQALAVLASIALDESDEHPQASTAAAPDKRSSGLFGGIFGNRG